MPKILPALLLFLLITPAATSASGIPADIAEKLLLQTGAAIEQGDWAGAGESLDELSRRFPAFRLTGILKDIIDKREPLPLTEPVNIRPADDEFISVNLKAELTLRRLAQADRPYPGKLPEHILRLGDSVRYGFFVDLERARLYLFENDKGTPRILADYYAGIGKQGIGKYREGDHGTPVGIYTITEYIPDNKLEELYGAGALPVDYPNHWDKRLGRTGGGIWIHGVPRNTYSRTPRSSRGCVTLSNELFDALRHYAISGETPVILADRIQWQDHEQIAATRTEIEDLLEQWRQNWNSLDFERYISHYSRDFSTSQKENYATWKQRKQQTNAHKKSIEVTLSDTSIFLYPGEENLIKIDYRQFYRSDNFNSEADKTQFWRNEPDGIWRIVFEDIR